MKRKYTLKRFLNKYKRLSNEDNFIKLCIIPIEVFNLDENRLIPLNKISPYLDYVVSKIESSIDADSNDVATVCICRGQNYEK